MNSILVGVKRFFKNKNTVTILAIIVSLAILYWAYNYRIKKETEPVPVPYATQTIGPRVLITKDMVSVKKVPGGIVTSSVKLTTADVVGKYVANDSVIPQNSLFYSDMIVEWDDLPSSIYEDIPNGNTIVALAVTLDSTYGNSIFPGNYIDLYYKTNINNKIVIGKFVESIKVLAVTDSAGNNVFESITTTAAPSYLIFSVDEETHLLLKKTTYLDGILFPVQRNADYSSKPSETKIVSAFIKKHIIDQTVIIPDEKININDKEVDVIGKGEE